MTSSKRIVLFTFLVCLAIAYGQNATDGVTSEKIQSINTTPDGTDKGSPTQTTLSPSITTTAKGAKTTDGVTTEKNPVNGTTTEGPNGKDNNETTSSATTEKLNTETETTSSNITTAAGTGTTFNVTETGSTPETTSSSNSTATESSSDATTNLPSTLPGNSTEGTGSSKTPDSKKSGPDTAVIVVIGVICSILVFGLLAYGLYRRKIVRRNSLYPS